MIALSKPSIARCTADVRRWIQLASCAAVIALPSAARAQDSLSYTRALTTWISLPATPGYEDQATSRIASATRGFSRDNMGNLVRRVGSGSPRRVIACGIDEVGYAVSEITEDGYLRVHASGNGRRNLLWDQFHEGQRIFVVGHAGDVARYVPGVFAVRSTHLWRRRPADEPVTTLDSLWVDVGAHSRAEVARLGIQLLDPVH